jgi:outer membrane lipoprotein-sorting protein
MRTPVLLAALLLCTAAAPADDASLIEKARAYLQNLSTVKSRFTQIDPRGNVVGGEAFLQRPGRARFDYDPSVGLIVTSDGHSVNEQNLKLKTLRAYPLSQTPLSLFLGKQIRLDRSVQISEVRHWPGGFTLVAREAAHPKQGSIELNFRDAPLTLTGWTVVNAQGGRVQVRLAGLTPAAPHDAAWFEIWRAERGG